MDLAGILKLLSIKEKTILALLLKKERCDYAYRTAGIFLKHIRETFLNALRMSKHTMQATIANFRQGKHTKYDNHMLLALPSVHSREEAKKYLKKKVSWKTQTGKTIMGTIVQVHGNKGGVRVIFERGMPGQAIGTKVEVQ